MEFSEKLQKLRKDRNLTQEQLAEQLYVSRTAVSKWESNRGYPNLESLKAIAKLFSVSVDELLSGEEAPTCRESGGAVRCKEAVLFACLDVSLGLLLVLPFFRETAADGIKAVSLLALTQCAWYVKAAFLSLVLLCSCNGFALLIRTALREERCAHIWKRYASVCSLLLAAVLVAGQEPYAALFALAVVCLKGGLHDCIQ